LSPWIRCHWQRRRASSRNFLPILRWSGMKTGKILRGFSRQSLQPQTPPDAIAWLYAWDVVCLSWEIRRERVVKTDIIKSAQILAVGRFLELVEANGSPTRIDFGENDRLARRSVSNSKSRREIYQKLAANGYRPSDILAEAYIRGAPNIDAIDRRLVLIRGAADDNVERIGNLQREICEQACRCV
jgi:hypothetical protein